MSDIRLHLNGATLRVPGSAARLTLLEYLREHLMLRGTKEGCAEGDCGACMVATADPGGRYAAVNACQQLVGTFHERSVVTVEGLARPVAGGTAVRLHPAQQALVAAGATQCGYCTPGVAVSLFCLAAEPEATDADIHYALAGNLCRCTGYRAILDAARAVAGKHPAGAHAASGAVPDRSWHTAGFSAPTTVRELEQILARQPDTRLLAGGTDLVNERRAHGDVWPPVVYLGRITELAQVERTEWGLDVGAAAPLTKVFAALLQDYPDLAELGRRFASRPIVNRATLGGNLANASPVGDLIPLMLALGAELVLRCDGVQRVIAVDDFYIGYRRTCLRPGEYLARVRIPGPGPGQRSAAFKVTKRHEQDTAAVLGCFRATLRRGRLQDVRASYGGLSEVPGRARHVEQALEGRRPDEATVAAARRAVRLDWAPISDLRGSAEYRLLVAENLVTKFAMTITSDEPLSIRVP